MEVTPEEELAWQKLESLMRDKRQREAREKAVIAAAKFAEENRDHLEIYTLRKAYEMGFIAAALGENNG